MTGTTGFGIDRDNRMTVIRVNVSKFDADGRSTSDIVKKIDAYLPANYAVAYSGPNSDGSVTVTVKGTDSAGWTAAGYVVPRLASGLYTATIEEEI